MALNPNHAFEDLDGVKCAVVEKNCTQARVDFLKKILEHNKFTVIVAKSPAPKAAKPAPPKPAVTPVEGASPEVIAQVPVAGTPPAPETFTVGVTDVSFSPINAVYNRELITPSGKVVTSAYWKQLDSEPKEEEWYWMK